MSERTEKRRRALALLDAEGLGALVLRRPGNVAWYSGGGRTHVLAMQEAGVADVVVRREGDEVVTAVNEAPRLQAEELGGVGAFRVLGWGDDRDAALPRGDRVGCDGPLAGSIFSTTGPTSRSSQSGSSSASPARRSRSSRSSMTPT